MHSHVVGAPRGAQGRPQESVFSPHCIQGVAHDTRGCARIRTRRRSPAIGFVAFHKSAAAAMRKRGAAYCVLICNCTHARTARRQVPPTYSFETGNSKVTSLFVSCLYTAANVSSFVSTCTWSFGSKNTFITFPSNFTRVRFPTISVG